MESRSKLIAGLMIGVLALLLGFGAHLTGLLDPIENITWDQRQKTFAKPVRDEVPIRLILLDEQSLTWAREGLGVKWPWPYEMYTPIIQFCRASGAKAVAMDVQFYDAGRYGPSDDRALAGLIAQDSDVALAVVPGEDPSGAEAWPEGLKRPGLKAEGLGRYLASNRTSGLLTERCRFPFDELARSAAALGHITPDTKDADEETDAVIRRVRPLIRFDGEDLPALGLSAYLLGDDSDDPQLRLDSGVLWVGEKPIPLDSHGRALPRFRKPTKTNNGHLYPSYSAQAVIRSQLRQAAGEEPSIAPETFKDAYVFFGFSATGLHDNMPTPVTALNPGVEIHATFLDNLIQGRFLRPARWLTPLLLTLAITVVGALGVLWVSGWIRHVGVYVIALPVPAVAGCIAFTNGIAYPIAWPSAAVGAALIGATLFNLATEGKQRRFIKRAFGYYLSPTVIGELIKDPSRLQLGGVRRDVTVMFIDLEGFTSMAETLEPQMLSDLLNTYLSSMSEAILEEDGTLDKFQGDAVMAFWNAPLEQPDHALRACRAALRCEKRLTGLRRQWLDLAGREPKIRIGIHTGPCVVGNMGAKQRFDYTVLGDTANLASRLEGANKVFGTTVLTSMQTWDQTQGGDRDESRDTTPSETGEPIAGRGIARIRVAGRNEPVIVVEPYSLDANAPHPTGDTFNEALNLCETGQYADAMHRFNQLVQDPASRAYAEKLAGILKSSPPAWDGIWDLTHKP